MLEKRCYKKKKDDKNMSFSLFRSFHSYILMKKKSLILFASVHSL